MLSKTSACKTQTKNYQKRLCVRNLPWLDRLLITARATLLVACRTEADTSPNRSSNLPISWTM